MLHASNLETTLTELYKREQAYGKALNEDVIAEHAYKMKKAEMFLLSEGTEKVKEAESVAQSKTEYLTHLTARAAKMFAKEKLADAQKALSARQSLLAADGQSDKGYSLDRRIT
mgnify:CR=1 FL=1